MSLQRMWVLMLGFGLVIAPAIGPAQEKGKGEKSKGEKGDSLLGRVIYLVPPTMAKELNLSEEQRREILKLEGSFRSKRTESMVGSVSRVMSIIDSLDDEDDNKEPTPVLALCHEITGGLLEARRLRLAYEKKANALLNPEQQRRFAQLRDRNGQLFPRSDGKTTFHFYPPHDADRLQLNDQQKQRLQELHREMEAKFRELLNEQQRKILDESKAPPKSTKDK